MKKVRSKKFTKEEYKSIISSVKTIMESFYAFYDISKEPPQPSFDKKYFNKVNIEEELDKIDTSEKQNYYDLYRGIKGVLARLRDLHITFYSSESELLKHAIVIPIYVETKVINSEPKPFGIPFGGPKYFRNGTEIFEVIKKNVNVPIKTINGMSPFDYIEEFGGEFNKLHNSHATYTFKQSIKGSLYIYVMPVTEEDLYNLTVVYENGDSFETDISILDITNQNNDSDLSFFDDPKVESEFIQFVDESIKSEMKSIAENTKLTLVEAKIPKTLFQHIEEFEEKHGVVNKLFPTYYFKNKNKKNKENSITWDYDYKENNQIVLQCRVDEDNKVNVYKVPTFSMEDITKYSQTLSDCITLFDKNDYPIIVILTKNGGGYVEMCMILTELVQPNIAINLWSTIRETKEITEEVSYLKDGLNRIDTCEEPDSEYFKKTKKMQKFGNVTSTVFGPYLLLGKVRESLDMTKKNLKHKRIPTNVIVFTDSFSYSAASIFTKSLQNLGGAIVVGYNGHPTKSDKTFDASQSPSAVVPSQIMKQYIKSTFDTLEGKQLFLLQLPFVPIYKDKNINIPQEYTFFSVDERSDIFESYDQKDENYQKFMSYAKNIIKKYNIDKKCSGVNPHLTLFSAECGSDNITYRGLACNIETGQFYTNNCTNAYCKMGYRMEEQSNSTLICVPDKCSTYAPKPPQPEKGMPLPIKITIIITIILLICACTYFFIIRKQEREETPEEEKMI